MVDACLRSNNATTDLSAVLLPMKLETYGVPQLQSQFPVLLLMTVFSNDVSSI